MSKSKTRKNMSLNLRNKIKWYKLGQRRCPCCGVQLTWGGNTSDRSATTEHLVLKSHGGSNHEFNVLIICWKCNNRRGNKDWFKWLDEINAPKKEWLAEKYLNSIREYTSTSNNYLVSQDIKKRIKVEAFMSAKDYLTQR